MTIVLHASVLMAIIAFSALQDGLSVKRTPKVGETVKYSMTETMQVNGGVDNLKATLSEKVVSIDKDGSYTVEQDQLDSTATHDDEKIVTPARKPLMLTYKPNRQIASMKGEFVDPFSYRIENLGTIIDPGKSIQVNDVWTSEFKADKILGTVEAKGEYKLLGEEKVGDVDTLKIHGIVKELEGDTPATNEFTEWISKDDGVMIQLDAKWTNAMFPGSTYPLSASIKMSRVPN